MLACAGCAPELEKLEQTRSPRGSLGEEVYKSLCRRVAGTEQPNDLDGSESEVLCLGDADEAANELAEGRDSLPPRLVALAERRDQIVQAIDDVFPGELGDGLEHLMRELLPFYEPPEEQIQNNTRAFARLLQALADDSAALEGLSRLARDGMLSREGSFGLYRSVLAHGELDGLLKALLPVLTDDRGVTPHLETLLSGLALELATSELDDEPDSDTRRLKDLLGRTRAEFAAGQPLHLTRRDARGLPIPTPLGDEPVPFPFVDDDADGLADVKDGEFVTDPNFGGALPEPFATFSEEGVARDDAGRAYAFTAEGEVDRERLLYEMSDVDATLLAGALREAGKLFGEDTQIAVHLAKLFPALFGEREQVQRRYGKATLSYAAPDSDTSPMVDLVHASTALIERPLYDQSLAWTERLLEDEESRFVGALAPLLALERRTRGDADAYPEAELAEGSVFWDELLFEIEKMSRRRKTADGPTLLELLLRGALGYARNMNAEGQPVEQILEPAVLRHQGALLAVLMRYKDEWRNNPKGESERGPDDLVTIGGFRTPVDRTQPDTPVTCGKDGCGGLVAGTPFEQWARPGQNCMIQRDGRPAASKDCGAPANQSILQRSLGLIWEMAGRSQCNKPITLGDLLDFAVLKDACANPSPNDTDELAPCAESADCAAPFSNNPDYVCDTARGVCVAEPASLTCQQLKQAQAQDRQDTIIEGEQQVAGDYACPPRPSPAPAPQPDDPKCWAYLDQYPAAFVDADAPGAGEPSTLLACHLLDLPDVGRSFGRALTHEFTIDIPNPWVKRYLEDVARAGDLSIPDCPNDYVITDPETPPPCIPGSARLSRDVYRQGMPESVDNLGELIEFLLDDSTLFQTEEDLALLRPDVRALTRVLFAPPGSSTFITIDPLLIRGAPPACVDAPALEACKADDTAETPAGGCCITNLKNPPFRYRLDTYYGATSFAWEQPVRFEDGTSLSLLDAMQILADGVNRTDFDAEAGDDPKNFEGTDFVFSTLGKLLGQHYDSPGNPLAQDDDPNASHFRSFSNLVSYERLLADTLDDGMLVPDQEGPDGEPLFDASALPGDPEQRLGLVYHGYPLLERLGELTLEGRDGLAFSADLTELLLSPHASCAPEGGDLRVIDGKGACDRAAAGAAGFVGPLTYRDGRSAICWNDGRCFDEPGAQRYPSPLYLVIDALAEMEQRIDAASDLLTAWQGARSGFFDTYLATEQGKFADRRLRGLLLTLLDYTRERWAAEAAEGGLASLGRDIVSDAEDFVESPVFAGALGVLDGLSAEPEALQALNRFAAALLGGARDEAQLRALVLTVADILEALPGDEELVALTRVMALALVPNAADVVLGSRAEPALEEGLLWRNLVLLRETVTRDDNAVLQAVLNNLVALPAAGTDAERAAPMAALADALLATNRVEPGASGALDAEDWRAVMTRMAEVMLDERRGFERLYQIVQCRNGDAEGLSCE